MRVAVVGGGYSGSILAIELVRRAPQAEVLLIEQRARAGLGAAYSTTEPGHLLNVRARNMSAFADAPAHFADWAARRGYGPDDYVPRVEFGRYLSGLLERAVTGGRVNVLRESAVAIAEDADGAVLTLSSGRRVGADAAALAGGNFPSRLPAGIEGIDDPWGEGGTDKVRALAAAPGDVLLVGTGLTMVDMALTLESAGFGGRMFALSRRGLVPRAHLAEAEPPLEAPPPERLAELVRHVRSHRPWRAAVDGLRPHSAALWRGLSEREKSAFARHLRPWWDVHRHRIAPQVGARIEALIGSGRLEVMAGRILGAHGGSVRVARRGGGEARLDVAGIVNCTGPQSDMKRVDDPLIRRLLAGGGARPGPVDAGLDVDESSRVVRADGSVSPSLYALGPLTRGAFWEIVAVPDIAVQAAGVARAMLAS